MLSKKTVKSEIERTKEEMHDAQILHYQRKKIDKKRYHEIYSMLKNRLYTLIKLEKWTD